MLRIFIAVLLLVPVTHADTVIFSNALWSLTGAADPASNAMPIAVTVAGAPAGNFSELKIAHTFTGVGQPQIFSVTGRGAVRPNLPPPGEAGGAFYLTGYWDCSAGLVSNLFITALDLVPNDDDDLILTGRVTNLTSMEANDFKMKFLAPDFDQVHVAISYTLYATRDICLDQARQDQRQGFRVARIASNFLSDLDHANNLLRYFTVTHQHCDCCFCYDVTGPVCGRLHNENAFLVCFRDRLKDPRLYLAHETIFPRNTPTLVVHFEKPTPTALHPQGLVAEATDPNAENVNLWGNWRKAKKAYPAGKRIGKFRFTLEARSPQFYNCDVGACY